MNKQYYRSLLILLAFISLAYVGVRADAAVSAHPISLLDPQNSSPGQFQTAIDCSQLSSLGIEKQLNPRASLIQSRCASGTGEISLSSGASSQLQASLPNYGGADTPVNDPTVDAYPAVTQNSSRIAAHGNTIVAVYNSSTEAPDNYSGISYSLDGGTTYVEILPSPLTMPSTTNLGMPAVAYSSRVDRFYVFSLVSSTACGSQGIAYWWSEDGMAWNIGTCVNIGSADDLPATWVDNNPGSSFYGRIYLSWNDFTHDGQLMLAASADNGATWPVRSILSAGLIRNQMGVSATNGTAYLSAMDEGGGGPNLRTSILYTSLNGGVGWTSHPIYIPFNPPGDTQCDFYFKAIAPIWRYQGWGSLGIGAAGVLHYVYTVGDGADAGDIIYLRSANGGLTWFDPVQLNTDAGTRAQWMPSIAVTANGKVMVSWYDRRNTDNDDYQRYARISLDNGASWKADEPLSDIIIPQPSQPDPNFNPCYAGDFDGSTASGNIAYTGWTDGRVQIGGESQQDIQADRFTFPAPDACVTGVAGWQLDARLPVSLLGSAVTSDGHYVYSAGGFNLSSGALDLFTRYDPLTNSWEALAPLPAPISESLAAYVDGKIYVFGGLITDTVQSTNYVYDVQSNNWTAGASLPGPRMQMGGGMYDGLVYLVGGYSANTVDPSSFEDQTWRYDPASDSWATMAPILSPLGGAASGVINGQLYITGGRDATHPALRSLYIYDIASDTWDTGTDLPLDVNYPGGAAYQDHMWVMGGGNPFLGNSLVPGRATSSSMPDTYSNALAYYPEYHMWIAQPFQNAARSFQGAAVAMDTIISVGGWDGATNTASAVVESLLRKRLDVLIAYADAAPPVAMQTQLLGLPGVGAVDLFDAHNGTPPPELLLGYDVVVVWSNEWYDDSTTLGDELADFVDAGGVVVETAFGWNGIPTWELEGRWKTGGYSAFTSPGVSNFDPASLGIILDFGDPLVVGVDQLNDSDRMDVTQSPGSTLIAEWSDALQLMAVKGRVVGVTGLFGDWHPSWSGDIGQIISNAGFSLRSPHVSCLHLHTFFPVTINDK